MDEIQNTGDAALGKCCYKLDGPPCQMDAATWAAIADCL